MRKEGEFQSYASLGEPDIQAALGYAAEMERIVLTLTNRTPAGEQRIVEPDQVRFRAG